MEDLYNILGVPSNATSDDIKQRFRFLAQAYHPDKFASGNHRKQAEEQFKKINEAYQILSDSKRRAKYDRERIEVKESQFQETYKQSQENNQQNYVRYAAVPKTSSKTSKQNNNKLFLFWIGIILLGSCGFVFLCFIDLPLLNSNTPTSFPINTPTFFPINTTIPNTNTPIPINTKPIVLPTERPTHTITPISFLSGSPITINGKYENQRWEVFVEKIIFTDKLTNPILGNIDKASGRFAIVFLQVINRGLSQSFYCSCFEFGIQDAEGNIYEIHLSATQSAQLIYELDSRPINPDDVLHAVAVFDISIQSANYTLVPGSLYDSESSGLKLNIP